MGEKQRERRIKGTPNTEDIEAIKGCWILISRDGKNMKEISVLMEEGDIKVTNMVKWGRHGKIIVCANEEESEKLETTKAEFLNHF